MGASMSSGGMRRSGRGRGSRSVPMSEINVTPFVDVMLVLLVIFMVAAPLLTVGVPIELPETAATPLEQEEEEPLTISMSADGVIALQSSEVAFEELGAKLTEIARLRDDDKVYIRADGALDYADVMAVMGALNDAGFRSIGLVTEGGGPTFDAPAE